MIERNALTVLNHKVETKSSHARNEFWKLCMNIHICRHGIAKKKPGQLKKTTQNANQKWYNRQKMEERLRQSDRERENAVYYCQSAEKQIGNILSREAMIMTRFLRCGLFLRYVHIVIKTITFFIWQQQHYLVAVTTGVTVVVTIESAKDRWLTNDAKKN